MAPTMDLSTMARRHKHRNRVCRLKTSVTSYILINPQVFLILVKKVSFLNLNLNLSLNFEFYLLSKETLKNPLILDVYILWCVYPLILQRYKAILSFLQFTRRVLHFNLIGNVWSFFTKVNGHDYWLLRVMH